MNLPGPDYAWLDRLAHDLRGPLAPLQTASYLLQRDDLDETRRKELLLLVERQVRRLGAMLEELGDWVRAGRGNLVGKREPCEPALLLDYAIIGAGLGGTPVDDDGSIAMVDGDAQRLTQMLRTLLDFAKARGTTPSIRLGSGDGQVRVCIELPGIAIASPGALVEEPEGEPYDEGLGLRLLLAREIARAHGGELDAGMHGDALVFRCTLPLADG